MFWGCFAGTIMMMIFVLSLELPALHNPLFFALLLLVFAAAAMGFYLLNRQRARSAVLYFEEPVDEVITRLGLMSPLPPASSAKGSQPTFPF